MVTGNVSSAGGPGKMKQDKAALDARERRELAAAADRLAAEGWPAPLIGTYVRPGRGCCVCVRQLGWVVCTEAHDFGNGWANLDGDGLRVDGAPCDLPGGLTVSVYDIIAAGRAGPGEEGGTSARPSE